MDFKRNTPLYWYAVELVCIAYEKKGTSYKRYELANELSSRQDIANTTARTKFGEIIQIFKKYLVEHSLYRYEHTYFNIILSTLVSYIEKL